jgi:hypothetical protein
MASDPSPPFPVQEADDGSGHDDDGDDDNATELCERCRRFDIQAFARTDDRTRGYRLHDVRSAAANDGDQLSCAFCALLLSSVEEIERPRDTTELEFNFLRIPVEKDPSMYVHMTLCEDDMDISTRRGTIATGLGANRLRTAIADRFSEVMNPSDHELCLVAEADSPAAGGNDIIGRYIGSDPSSDAHLDTIRGWVRACERRHPKCKQTVSGQAIDPDASDLPTRCVEVSTQGPDLAARLITTTDGMRGKYITLTHRWNLDTELCKTTTENCDARVRGIDLHTLPKLFRDVFAIAARLHIRHVWIDSLCIIQSGDSGADWRREAPRMAQYYQHSLFTLAGTMHDMDNGLLHHPHGDSSPPWGPHPLVRLPYRDQTGALAGHFFVYRRHVPVIDDYWSAVRQSILFRRGWILQEWLLSKRLVWYTPKGLFFECHSEGPRTEYRERVMVENARGDHLRAQLKMKGEFHFENAHILDFWYHAMEQYSTCDLTKPEKDRILAVAGLAKEVGKILADRVGGRGQGMVEGQHHEAYFAGLWLRDLHHGLLWEGEQEVEDDEEEDDSLTSPHTATRIVGGIPSWSWASLMMPARWPEKDKEAEKGLRVVGLCVTAREDRRSDHGPEYTVERSELVQQERDQRTVRRALFDPTNMFACLHVSGRLFTVHIRGYLGAEKAAKVAVATAYSRSPGSNRWRALCSPAKPEVVAGWASGERGLEAEGRDVLCADAGVAVHALHVSTRFARSGLLVQRKTPVLDVLLIRETDARKQVFQRLGVGRIFGRDLVKLAETVERRDFQLV